MKDCKFNFIVGIGRSGTTLLMSMLNSHPKLQATPEVNFFNFFNSSWKNKTSFTDNDLKDINIYFEAFKNRKQASGFSWDIEQFKKNINGFTEINFNKIYNAFYLSFAYNNIVKEITHNFDKNPINTLFLKDIASEFPDSKFILLVRDPRANYLSRKEKNKKRKANIYLDTQRWKIYNEKAWETYSKFPDRFYILKYEDLVSNPETKIKELAQFFDFEYHNDILNFHQNIKENSLKQVVENPILSQPQAITKYEKLSKPINTERMEAWKEKLTEEEIEICSFICGDIASELGYNIEAKSCNINKWAFLKGIISAKIDYYKNITLYLFPLKYKLKRIKPL